MDKKDDGVDDTVYLTGLGLRTEWRLPPNTTRCPFNFCREAFADRTALTAHYQERHASKMVLCEICKKPLSAKCLGDVFKHYREKHPNEGRPLNLIRHMRKSIQGRSTDHVSLILKRINLVYCQIHLPHHILILILCRFAMDRTAKATKTMIQSYWRAVDNAWNIIFPKELQFARFMPVIRNSAFVLWQSNISNINMPNIVYFVKYAKKPLVPKFRTAFLVTTKNRIQMSSHRNFQQNPFPRKLRLEHLDDSLKKCFISQICFFFFSSIE